MSNDVLKQEIVKLFDRDSLMDADILQGMLTLHRKAVGFKHHKVAEKIEAAICELQWSVRMKLQYEIGLLFQPDSGAK